MASGDQINNTGDADCSAKHLCVFVHGLWGNPQHLSYLSDSLRLKYGDSRIKILVCKRNTSSFTYDGIEVGGERVAKEIEETLEELGKNGHKIEKFSIVGYSLGGLIARYAIGLLYHKGLFESMHPVNFTTFATPHLGVRTPLTGYQNYVWNYLGSRVMSASGAQLFAIDKFRDTGRPLLSVLADPESIFMHALRQFQHRSLYTNIINDRSAVYYTTSISKIDPYKDLSKLRLHYDKGYEKVVLNGESPYSVLPEDELPSFYERLALKSKSIIQWSPRILALVIFMPLGISAFLINSTIQTFRSRRRILLHENDSEGLGFQNYRVSWMVQDMRASIENAIETVNATQPAEYLTSESEDIEENHDGSSSSVKGASQNKPVKFGNQLRRVSTASTERNPDFPTLALSREQFTMIQNLDDIGFQKHPVYIRKTRWTHAAIVVRSQRASFDEGKIVVRHWLEIDFRI